MGCIATLSKLISQLGIRGLPFFKLLKKQDRLQWTQEAQEDFEDLKKYLTSPPTLVAPEPHKNLHLYISVISNVVSTTIVIERGVEDKAHGLVSNLLHQRSAERLQNSVFSYHEAHLCLTHHVSQAIPRYKIL
jgi:hypothetical protein